MHFCQRFPPIAHSPPLGLLPVPQPVPVVGTDPVEQLAGTYALPWSHFPGMPAFAPDEQSMPALPAIDPLAQAPEAEVNNSPRSTAVGLVYFSTILSLRQD